jgi:hypothetical protein
MIGLKEAVEFKESVLGIKDENKEIIEDSIETIKKLIKPVIYIDQEAEVNTYNMTDDGNITITFGGDEDGTE